MDAARVKPALSTNPPSEVDRLSSLPDCLIFQIFLNLMTKDVVQTSALSTRWTTLWKDVHGLDLDTEDFNIHETFVSFVDNFLERNRGSSIHLFKVTYDSSNKPDLVNRWVDTAVRLKVEHLDVSDILSAQDIMMNPTVIYDYARYVQLPVFRNLYTLCVRFNSYMWEMLPVFLEVCPNLKTLVVGTSENYLMVGITVIARPWNLLSSLEHVDIERPLKGEALEMALVGYLLENSPNLKKLSLSLHDSLKKGKYVHKLTLSLDDAPKKEESDIFIELLNFPRLSCSCQIIVR
uniref:F-box domain-containing protein n=1 Tax=Brassica oleracea var. oleracea TaxID=109376 RepID=A0A0D3DTY4_BRAOL